MRISCWVIAIVLFAVSAPAETDLSGPAQGETQGNAQNPSRPQYTPDQLCILEGTLLFSTTGNPAKKVEVILSAFRRRGRPFQNSALADSNGHFIFSKVEPGDYSMQAGGGAVPLQIYSDAVGGRRWKVISLRPGEHVKDIVFKIAPGAVISGAVYDDDGDPVVGAEVTALNAGGLSPGGIAGSIQTNDQGQYRIYALAGGKYILSASTPGDRPESGESLLPTFYPAASDASEATPVEVHPGDEASAINFTMTRVPGVSVRGRVIYGSSSWPTYVRLIRRARDDGNSGGPQFGAQVQGEGGNFEIKGAPPGSYDAVAYAADGDRRLMGRTNVEVGTADVNNVTISLDPSFDVHGRVRTEPGVKLDFTTLRVFLQPSDDRGTGGEGTREIKPDGTFVIHQLFAGSYKVFVGNHPEEFYLKSARMGDSDGVSSDLAITSGSTDESLEIFLSHNGGTITGTVLHDDKPVPGALVTLVPDPPNRKQVDLYDSKTADEFGRFTLLGVPPGDFKIFAWDSPVDVNPLDQDFLKAYEDKGQSIHVEEKKTVNVQLESISLENGQQ